MITINKDPSRRQLRQFAGLVFPLFCGLVGLIAFYRFGAPRVAYGLWGFGVVAGALGLIWLPVARWLYLGLIYATYPIGFVVSHVMLLILYYLVLTPIGLVLRLLGKDPLGKRPDPGASTYWQPHDQVTDVERYFRQF